MFAVVRTGGKQYRVAAGDKIAVEKLAGAAGDTITLGDVLLAGEGDRIDDAASVTVSAEIIAQAKSEKVFVFKKRRRHNYRRKNGHRQQMTLLRIVAVGDDRGEQRSTAGTQAETPAAAKTASTPAASETASGEGAQAAPVKTAKKKAAPVKDESGVAAAPKAHKAAPKKDGAGAKATDSTDVDTTANAGGADAAANSADKK